MKTNIIIWMISLSMILLMGTGCQDQTDVYKEFVVPGGHVYPGLVVGPKVLSGKYRVQITGSKPMGSKVNEIRVFWDYFTDSVSYKIDENTPENITIEIKDLKEISYLFTIRTYNDKGDVSVPLELFGQVYGDKYIATLVNRNLITIAYNEQSEVKINFDQAFAGTVYTDLFYFNNNEDSVTLRVPADQSEVVIADYNAAKPIQYITAFKPDSTSIDTFYSELNEMLEIGFPKLKVINFSSQHNANANMRAADVVDGNPATRWHTLVGKDYPHFVTVDMSIPRKVNAFEIFTHMVAGEQATNRAPVRFKLEISLDNTVWTDLGEFDFDRFDYRGGQMFYIPGNQIARYFRFTGLQGADKNMVLGEIDVHSYITEETGQFYGTWESTNGVDNQTFSFKNKYGFYTQGDGAEIRMNWSVENGMLSVDLIAGKKSYSFSEDGKQLTIAEIGVFNKIK